MQMPPSSALISNLSVFSIIFRPDQRLLFPDYAPGSDEMGVLMWYYSNVYAKIVVLSLCLRVSLLSGEENTRHEKMV